MFIFKNYYELNDIDKKLFFNFLNNAANEIKQPAHENMQTNNWANKTNTLLYILEKTDRFKNGLFSVLFDDNKVAACSGSYISDFSKEVAILGVRTWIASGYRNKLVSRDYILPYQRQWAVNNNCKIVALTFNEYNKNLIKLWNRIRLGESRPARKLHHFGYKNLSTLDFPVTIQYTKQYVLYEKINDNFEFDWSNIRYQE